MPILRSIRTAQTHQFKRTGWRAIYAVFAASVAVFSISPGANAQMCTPAWQPTFGGASGVDGDVHALTVFDDGSGPALYVGGQFATAGGVPASNIARWDGQSWSSLAGGLGNGVRAMVVFDDGTGPALYAGGQFNATGTPQLSNIAKWDGQAWTLLEHGSGTNGPVFALTVFDDGSGPALYAGGIFTTAGGINAASIAKWDGQVWAPLGSGIDLVVQALTVFDDGSGPALYAGGFFTSAGGVAANSTARWDGQSWSPLGSGVAGFVNALTVFDDGTGAALFVGGSFTNAGGVNANRIAKWDGQVWAALGADVIFGEFSTLTVLNDGSGPALYAGGSFGIAGGIGVNNIAKWDGLSWMGLDRGLTSSVFALTAFDDGSGPALYAGGSFTNIVVSTFPANTKTFFANHISKWDSQTWSPMGNGISGSSIRALTVFDDGTGPSLFVGGTFSVTPNTKVTYLAKWDGQTWSPLGSGVTGGAPETMTVFDDGTGMALYVGGGFSAAGSVPATSIARWDGQSWSPLGSGSLGGVPFPFVAALTVFDDGSGPALYAAGRFLTAGGIPVNNIAKWDGSSWSALGNGLPNTGSTGVFTLHVYDDGTGQTLYAGGSFTLATGAPADYIAK